MTDRQRTDDILQRDSTDPGDIAHGDGQLDTEPPNVVEAEPPAASISREPETAASDSDDADQIESDLDSLQRDLASASDRYLRLVAEFDNYRKRVDRERAELHGRAQGELAAKLLDSLDDLERVVHHSSDDSPLLQGVQLVERKLKQVLQSAGLERVDAEGAAFDPNSMEAVAMVATDSAAEDDTVSDVFQQGYYFKGTLIRPARVRVKKHGA